MQTTAIVFPGQGSQSLGMLADTAAKYDAVSQHFEKASQVLGFDLWDIVQNGPEEKLNQTEITQPAILTASIALWEIAQQQNLPKPQFLAGHSLGEYSALVAAGSLGFEDAVRLTHLRGKFMTAAVPQNTGAMAAVLGLADDVVEAACNKAKELGVVACANYNAPMQVVIAGASDAVAKASELCQIAGAKRVLPLKVSVPSHCQLMEPAAEKLAHELDAVTIKAPAIPVLHNVDVSEHKTEAEIKQALLQQLYSPVRWVETVQKLTTHNVAQIIECGPGRVLTGLGKRIARDIEHKHIESLLD